MTLIQAQYAKFRIGGKWGLISNLGHVELEPEFYEIEQAPGRFYFVEYKPKHWGTMTLTKRFNPKITVNMNDLFMIVNHQR